MCWKGPPCENNTQVSCYFKKETLLKQKSDGLQVKATELQKLDILDPLWKQGQLVVLGITFASKTSASIRAFVW